MNKFLKKSQIITLLLLTVILISCNVSNNEKFPNTSSEDLLLPPPTVTSIPTEIPTSLPITVSPIPQQAINLALGKNVTTSLSRADNPASLIVDGINQPENFWSAGAEPPQWIEIDLGKISTIDEIRLIVYQFPEGDSVHKIWGKKENNDAFEELHTFTQLTKDGDILIFKPLSPLTDIRYIRVETLDSAPDAYVEWREIEVIGLPTNPNAIPVQIDSPSLIFYNGNIITMDDNNPSASAIMIEGDKIVAVGNDQEILGLKTSASQLIDLSGATIIPGFVDAHTHILKDMGLGLEDAQQLALENGITTVTEMTTLPDFLAQLKSFAEQDLFRVRVTAYLGYTDPCGNIEGDWYVSHPPDRQPNQMLQISGVKIFADGGVCGIPAVSFDYPDNQGQGDLWFTDSELNAMVEKIHNQGYQVAIHAQGDRAIEQALNAIEAALGGEPNVPRHRIEHNPFARPDLLPRYSEIGIVPTIVGFYPTCAEVNRQAYSNYFGLENVYWLENWRAFVDANPDLRIAWHGDDPWMVPISPLVEMHSLVTRIEVDENGTICEPPDWLASHALTAEEVLPMMTINSAYALFRENEIGSLTPGKFADLLILSGNPLKDAESILDIEIWLTMVGGNTEYCAAPDINFCP